MRSAGRFFWQGTPNLDYYIVQFEAPFLELSKKTFEAFARPRIRGEIANALAKSTEARAAYSARRRLERDRIASLERSAVAEGGESFAALRDIVVGLALGFMIEDGTSNEAADIASDTPSAYDNAAWNEALCALDTKLATLPDRERMVLDYHYKKGLRFSEIASLLDLSRGRISQIHSNALAQLRVSLAKFR